ncbi:MAG: hypothetical protein QOJ06_251, partial [Pseudonocardiales bacterium]|nr:hypothetical protein [Pseudonocardiales bacterium]
MGRSYGFRADGRGARAGVVTLPGRPWGRAAPSGGRFWVAGDPSIGRGCGRSLDHRPRGGRSTRRGLGGKPTTFGEATRSMELIPGINAIRLLQQGREISQPAPGARARPKRGVRVRSAIRHTARYEGANASNTPDSGPADPPRGRRAEHTTRRSTGAAHYAPPTAATRCRRCSPARQACRADPTLPVAGSDPIPASPRHPPTVPPCISGLFPPRS